VTLIIITIGVSIAIRGVALILWGTDPLPLPPFTGEDPIFIFSATLLPQGLWVLGMMVFVVAGLYLFFNRTITGKALRACAINRSAARLMGVSADRMSLFSFALSAALGAAAGIVVAPITAASYDAGTMLGLKGFVAAVVGGLTSMPGAVVGGLALGVLESLGAGLLRSGYKDAIAFLLLLVVLLWRPSGFFGTNVGKGGL
jgi:branched-chain amino acid transport system permease protein